jgi:hypothetical protein
MSAPDKLNLDARYRTMLILWLALMMSVVMYFVTTQVVNPSTDLPYADGLLSWLFACVGIFSAVVSFVVRSHFLNRAVEKQDMSLVQTALVIGCAFCEVPALLGMVERFMFSGRNYIFLLAISFVSMALHFPRRASLLAASYKDPRFGA